MKKQVRAYFSGRVQGVGFRFTAQEIAAELGVLGWVKNLRDGKVEVVAEAEEEALGKFLGQLKQRFSGYIKDTDIRWQEAAGDFKDFRIVF